MSDVKKIFEEHITCPWCKRLVIVEKKRKTLKETVKGEFEDTVIVKKDKQTKLAKSWLKKRP